MANVNGDRTTPATKGDLLDLKEEITANLETLKEELTANIGDMREEFATNLGNLKDELIEAIRDGQAEVLRAFYGFSQTVLDRFREQDTTEAALKRRMATLETRVFEIEKRLNIPPSGI